MDGKVKNYGKLNVPWAGFLRQPLPRCSFAGEVHSIAALSRSRWDARRRYQVPSPCAQRAVVLEFVYQDDANYNLCHQKWEDGYLITTSDAVQIHPNGCGFGSSHTLSHKPG